MTLADQKNTRTGSVPVTRMTPRADLEVDSRKTNPPTKEIAAANASICKDSQILWCKLPAGIRKAVWNKAYKERMVEIRVTGLATSTSMLHRALSLVHR